MTRLSRAAALALTASVLATGCAVAAPDKALPTPPGPAGRFADLDAYLAWLEKRSHLGGSWYREVRPGVFVKEAGNLRPPGPEAGRTFTRAELERKFGFAPKSR